MDSRTAASRTTRLTLEALAHLSSGFDVVVIAHPASVAFDIADQIQLLATTVFSIPCELSDANELVRHGDVPIIVTRPFGWVPEYLPAWRTKPKILVDHSAVFERAGEWNLSKREREVFA